MKTKNIMVAALMALLCPVIANAQETTKASAKMDSVAIRLHLQQLTQRQQQLGQQITAEDRKRNQDIAGVTPENMEKMNFAQDSLCLALRSELTDVELEIAERQQQLKELAPVAPAPAATDSVAVAPQATTPQKPQKPSKMQQAVQALKNRPNKNQPNKNKPNKK